MEVGEFCRRAATDISGLAHELQDETGRATPSERYAWERSLPRLGDLLAHENLSAFHLHLGKRGNISLEYRLPASASWVDAVLLGRSAGRPEAVLLELKDWDVRGDQPGPRPGLIHHQGALFLHPSEQVRGYVEYCRGFHSAVAENQAGVHGCAFLTSAVQAPAYVMQPHHELTAEYPVFTANLADLSDRFPSFLAGHLREPDPSFAKAFEAGRYVQDRNLVRQIAKVVEDPLSSPFVLLDKQREGFEHCMKHIDRALASRQPTKTVVIIEGPPGSGKSVLAAHLWSKLIQEPRIEGPVVLTSTSSSQKDNWRSLFRQAAHGPGGSNVVIPANLYNPGITPTWVKRQRDHGQSIEVSTWRENVERYLSSGPNRSPNDVYAVSIVDEAHALIDPTVPGKQGVPTAGWVHHAGPQAWHIMRSSKVSIFLRDADQSFRDNETTSRERLETFAGEFGVPRVEVISLAGAQFRCGGSSEYMDWVDATLGLRGPSDAGTIWRRQQGGPFEFEIVGDPGELDERLWEKHDQGSEVRLLASYARRWVTKKEPNPHDLPPERKDFCILYRRNGQKRVWARIWNHVPDEDYTRFVQAPEGTRMADDPLCEVGCPYVVRGFDYDYVGMLWLSDLVWRGEWVAQPQEIHETAWKNSLPAAKKESPPGRANAELVRRLKRAYRILLSRAIRGMYVWFEDEETRAHVESQLGEQAGR